MGLFTRKRRPGIQRTGSSDDLRHLAEFLETRSGVEAYVEPRTSLTDTTVVLVAADGEWTRRRVDGPDGAHAFAKKHKIPLYDAAVVGYPRRMREWTARQKAQKSGGPSV
ncbi:oxidoreductase [Jatrophihabitans fulvus]